MADTATYAATLSPALRTIEDYERCAREASPAVRHVRVRGAANDPRMPAGVVEVRVKGRFWRPLPEHERRRVHRAIVARNQVMVELRMRW